MSNSLIPYSFTPGTKAKAQEVNANFIALSEKIEENREFTTTQIADTIEKIEQVSTDTGNKKADLNLGNTTLISNCIIEAPNGVVSAEENVITVKKGLKVLIPDGLNEDGTVKNILHEIAEDTAVTTVKNSNLNCIYITENGCNYAEQYVATEFEPYTKKGIWFSAKENISYLYNSDSSLWEPIKAVVIATYQNPAGTVKLDEIAKPVKLLSNADKMVVMNWFMPCYSKMVSRSWDTTYTATKNGWIYTFATCQTNQFHHINVNGVAVNMNWVNTGSQASSNCFFPVKRGDTYRVYGNYVYHGFVYFIPMEGDQ